jgi:amidase
VYKEALRGAVEMVERVSESEDPGIGLGAGIGRGIEQGTRGDRYNCFVAECLVEPTFTGPLSDMDVGVKDNISVAGVPMSLGSVAMEGYLPDADAAVVTRLLESGARIVGKLRMDAFSFGSEGFGSGLDPRGRCDNPVAPGYLTGGSSSGPAAAVAGHLVDVAIGGDQGGSIRVPAAWCSVVGLKPTRGAVPTAGVIGLESTIDAVGPLCRTVEGAALAFGVISTRGQTGRAGEWPAPDAQSSQDLRVGLLTEAFDHPDGDREVDALVLEAATGLRRRGALTRIVSVPQHRDCQNLAYVLQLLGASFLFNSPWGPTEDKILGPTFTEALEVAVTKRSESLPPRAKLAIMLNSTLGRDARAIYLRCQHLASRFQDAYDHALDGLDVLLLPTTPLLPRAFEPPKTKLEAVRRALLRPGLESVTANTAQFNVTGHPALTVPVGRRGGPPVGAMLVGRWFDEASLFVAGKIIEEETGSVMEESAVRRRGKRRGDR